MQEAEGSEDFTDGKLVISWVWAEHRDRMGGLTD
jgi:hypothetical protein